MIEIKNICYFEIIKDKLGPFLIFFYNKDQDEMKDDTNLLLIKYLRSIEKYFFEIPMIAFDYEEFVYKYSHYNISSCNDILIFEKTKTIRVYHKPTYYEIFEILNKTRQEYVLINQIPNNKYESEINNNKKIKNSINSKIEFGNSDSLTEKDKNKTLKVLKEMQTEVNKTGKNIGNFDNHISNLFPQNKNRNSFSSTKRKNFKISTNKS